MTGCLIKIRETLKTLKLSEKKVAEYIVNFTDEVVGMSIGELAEKSGASKSAVIRLCKTLNYDSYRELVVNVASDLAAQQPEQNAYTDIRPGDDIETIIKNVCLNNKKSIDDTLLVLSKDEVQKAVNALHKAKRIDFYGVGASGIIAMDAQQKFMRINKYAMAYSDPHLQFTSAANLTKGDVAVIISFSGETVDVIESMRVAKESGATIIAITKYGRSTLSSAADINLYLSSPETSIRSGAMGSRIAQLNVVDIIFSSVASMEYSSIKANLDKTYSVTTARKYKK